MINSFFPFLRGIRNKVCTDLHILFLVYIFVLFSLFMPMGVDFISSVSVPMGTKRLEELVVLRLLASPPLVERWLSAGGNWANEMRGNRRARKASCP